MAAPLRFLHASDLHLETAPRGALDLPETLRPRLADAPFAAARNLFDLAIAQAVDFVVLAGDVLDPKRAGARGIAFLVQQFERLAAKGIAAYWLPGEVDRRDRWPAAVELPDNVHWIDESASASWHHRGGEAIALVGTPRQLAAHRNTLASDESRRLFAVSLTHGEYNPQFDGAADYHALGRGHERRVIRNGRPWVIQAGTPQGRGWDEPGTHGCTLVEVDAAGNIRATARVVDVARWHEDDVSIDDCGTRAAWESLLRTRVYAIAASAGDRMVMLRLRLLPGKTTVARTTREHLASQMVAWLREQFGHRATPVWTATVDVAPATTSKTESDEETLRGEFLRTMDKTPLDEAAGDAAADALVRDRSSAWSESQRAMIHARTRELGSELLRGQAHSEAAKSNSRTGSAV